MSDRRQVNVEIRMDVDDFQKMLEGYGRADWQLGVKDESDEDLRDRYDGVLPGRQWRWCYLVGMERMKLVMMRSYLDMLGVSYEVVYDIAVHPNGMFLGYTLLTDFNAFEKEDAERG